MLLLACYRIPPTDFLSSRIGLTLLRADLAIFLKIIQNFRMTLDITDSRLLAALQRDSSATTTDLSEALHLSPSQIGRRKTRLEAEGYITHYTARLAPEKLGLTVQAFVQVGLGTHGAENAKSFARLIATRPEITSAWTMTGEADYLLRVWTPTLAALNTLIHEVILAHPAVARVQSQIVMDQLKSDAPLPV